MVKVVVDFQKSFTEQYSKESPISSYRLQTVPNIKPTKQRDWLLISYVNLRKLKKMVALVSEGSMMPFC